MDVSEAAVDPLINLTHSQRALLAARKYQKGMSTVDLAREFKVDQGTVGLAMRVLEFCPEELAAIENGTKSLAELDELSLRRSRARVRVPIKGFGLAPGQIPDSQVRRVPGQASHLNLWTRTLSIRRIP